MNQIAEEVLAWLRRSRMADACRTLRTRVRRARDRDLSPEATFVSVLERNAWGDPESVSGTGSNLRETQTIRHELPRILRDLKISTLLDVPCGDFNWMREVSSEIDRYIGADIVPELVARNRTRYGTAKRRFLKLDLLSDSLPPADAIFCRDCLVHFSTADVALALDNIHRSGAEFLITTTFPHTKRNRDIVTGEWRPLNLEAAPFNFPPPLELIVEGSTEASGHFSDKSVGVWRIQDLPRPAQSSS